MPAAIPIDPDPVPSGSDDRGRVPVDFEATYRAHACDVGRWVRRLAGPAADVEDVVHDVFVVAMKRWDDYDERSCKVTTWLFAIVVRVVQGQRSKRRVREALTSLWPSGWWRPAQDENGEAIDGGPSCEQMLEANQSKRMLYAMLDEIGEKYRTALILHEIEGLPCEEVAAITGTNVRNVWVRVHRARKLLTEKLAKASITTAHSMEGGRL